MEIQFIYLSAYSHDIIRVLPLSLSCCCRRRYPWRLEERSLSFCGHLHTFRFTAQNHLRHAQTTRVRMRIQLIFFFVYYNFYLFIYLLFIGFRISSCIVYIYILVQKKNNQFTARDLRICACAFMAHFGGNRSHAFLKYKNSDKATVNSQPLLHCLCS